MMMMVMILLLLMVLILLLLLLLLQLMTLLLGWLLLRTIFKRLLLQLIRAFFTHPLPSLLSWRCHYS